MCGGHVELLVPEPSQGRCGLGSRSADVEPKTSAWDLCVSVVVDGLVQSTA